MRLYKEHLHTDKLIN